MTNVNTSSSSIQIGQQTTIQIGNPQDGKWFRPAMVGNVVAVKQDALGRSHYLVKEIGLNFFVTGSKLFIDGEANPGKAALSATMGNRYDSAEAAAKALGFTL